MTRINAKDSDTNLKLARSRAEPSKRESSEANGLCVSGLFSTIGG